MGEKLGVRNVLEGSVRKQGNRIRITAQLINVQDGFHLWSEKYDRNVDDIFAIQEEIALSITEKLKISLLDMDIERITKSYTSNPQAYELYLKGRFNINRRGRLILEGLKNFEEAKRIDPNYAPAYSGYADAACLAGFYSFFPAKEIYPKGKESALKAIMIDPTLCEPYTSLGFYYECFEWNFVEAKKNFQKAIELNPFYPTGHWWYAMLYLSWIEANFKESQREGWKAIKLDPLSSVAHGLQTANYYAAGEFEEAIRIGKIGIDLDPNNYLPYKMTALSLIGLHKIPEAIEMIQESLRKSNRYQWSIFDLIWAYSHIPDREAMNELLKELDERSQQEYISPCNLGTSGSLDG